MNEFAAAVGDRHSRGKREPGSFQRRELAWIAAFAGITELERGSLAIAPE